MYFYIILLHVEVTLLLGSFYLISYIIMLITTDVVAEFLQLYKYKDRAYSTIYHHEFNFKQFIARAKDFLQKEEILVDDITNRIIEHYK